MYAGIIKMAQARAALLMYAYYEFIEKKDVKTSRRIWVKKYISKRQESGFYNGLIAELKLEDPDLYRRVLRMNVDAFDYLVDNISPYVQRNDTNMRKAIPAAEKLAVTLRFLATGED